MNPLARLGAVAATLLLTVSVAATAEAAKFVHNDAAGDVQVEKCVYTDSPTPEPSETTTPAPETTPTAETTSDGTGDEATDPDPEEECTTSAAPTHKDGDIIRTVIRHTSTRLIIRTTYRELYHSDNFSGVFSDIRTSKGAERIVLLTYGQEFSPKGSLMIMRGTGERMRCDAHKSIDFSSNVIEVRIPRTCLGSPRWVKAGIGHISFSFTGDDTTETDYSYGDDALSSGIDDDLTWSPRIRRG